VFKAFGLNDEIKPMSGTWRAAMSAMGMRSLRAAPIIEGHVPPCQPITNTVREHKT